MVPIADKVRASLVFRRLLDEAETAALVGQDLRFYDPRELPVPMDVAHVSQPEWVLPMLYVHKSDKVAVF